MYEVLPHFKCLFIRPFIIVRIKFMSYVKSFQPHCIYTHTCKYSYVISMCKNYTLIYRNVIVLVIYISFAAATIAAAAADKQDASAA